MRLWQDCPNPGQWRRPAALRPSRSGRLTRHNEEDLNVFDAISVGQRLSGAALTTQLWGQGLTGQISGSVRDQSGSVLVNAAVELINDGTGQRRSVTTDETGAFLVPPTPRRKIYAHRWCSGLQDL